MLVFTRYVNETVVIGGHIVVTIVHAEGGRVRVGIEAPRDIPVHRGEVQKQIDNERRGN